MPKNYKVIFPENRKVALVEWEMPTLGPKDMLVKTIVSQISIGTELTMLEANVEADSPWMKENIVYPNYGVGYSNAGQVVDVGSEVSRDLIGRYVFSGSQHQLYSAVNIGESYVGKTWIPENVKPEDATFGSLATVANGSVRCAKIRPGDVCVVYGAGIVGQMAARLAKVAGAATVIVADVSDFRLSKLPQEPCFVPVNSAKTDVAEFVKAHCPDGAGADVVFETTSVPSLVEQELKCLRQMGKLVITSSPKGKSLVDLDYCSRRGITIIGAHNFRVHPPVETPENRWTRQRDTDYFMEMLHQKRLTVNEMHTHKFHYTDAVSAYEMLMADRTQALSVLLTWED